MKSDPKDPNAWWAVKLPALREMHSMASSGIDKKRLYWIVPLMIALAIGEIYFFSRLMK